MEQRVQLKEIWSGGGPIRERIQRMVEDGTTSMNIPSNSVAAVMGIYDEWATKRGGIGWPNSFVAAVLYLGSKRFGATQAAIAEHYGTTEVTLRSRAKGIRKVLNLPKPRKVVAQ